MKNILIVILLDLSAIGSHAADTNAIQLTPAFVNALVEELRTHHSALRPAQSGDGDFAALQTIAVLDAPARPPVSKP